MGDTPTQLTAFLANSDARCPSCRYALRGCTSDKCPECGCELALAIAAANNPAAPVWWYAAVYGCGVAVFLSLALLAQMLGKVVRVLEDPNLPTMVRSGFAPMGDLPRWSAIFVVVLLCLLTGLLLAWMIRQRRNFERWSAAKQVVVGALCWMSPAIVLGFIAWLTR